MLANTIVLPLSTGNITVVRINQDNYGSEYRFVDATHSYVLKVRHSEVTHKVTGERYHRINVEVVRTVFASGGVLEYYQKHYFVTEQKISDSAVVLADGVADYMIATSNAFLVSLMAWES
jgi:hypothetical protein